MVNLDEDDPTVAKLIKPEPLLMPRLNTPLVSPSVTLPLLELVMLVLTWSGFVREAPFKSILPVAVMADGR